MHSSSRPFPFFSFTDPTPTELYTLSLHDALPIYVERRELDHLREPHALARERLQDVLQVLQTLASEDRKSTRLNSSHVEISYAVFCLKKKKTTKNSAKRSIITNILHCAATAAATV